MSQESSNNDLPVVSIIMPIRNEVDFVERAIKSVLDNDYPPDKMQILVADGMSTDGTREVAERLFANDSRVLLYDNENKVVPNALNKGIAKAKGDIIITLSGHSLIAPDFIKECVYQLQTHPEAWCAGGPVETVSLTSVGRVIALAMSSPVGVGNAMWRLGNYEGYVDTIAFGAYWRWVFDKIGLFDEELVRNQDDDFSFRLIVRGGKIFMTPKIRSQYYARSSLGKLWRQYFQYGFWRIKTFLKHRRPATVRQTIPLMFVLSLVSLACAGFVSPIFWWILAATLVTYALGLTYGSIQVGRKIGWRYCFLAQLVFAILHFAYGLGCLWGIVRFVLLRAKWMKSPKGMSMSR